MRAFVFTLFLGAIMLCEGTEDNKETDQLNVKLGDLAPQLHGRKTVPHDDEIPELLDTDSNLSGEIQSPVSRSTTGLGFRYSSSPQDEYHLEAISTGSTCPSTPRCEPLTTADQAARLERTVDRPQLHSRLNPNAKAFRPSASSVQLIPPPTSAPTQPLPGISRDLMVFQSLLMMLSIPTESEGSSPWRQYLRASIRNRKCSVMDLCNEYHRNFNCYPDGRLRVIGLSGQEFDHLNLLMIPNTVTMLYLKKTKLKTISKWADLTGKSLKFLALGQNPDLQVDLGGLKCKLDHLSLEPTYVVNVRTLECQRSLQIKVGLK